MKYTVAIILLVLAFRSNAQELNIQSPIKFLVLGDSYTIGESVPTSQRWPTQLGDSLVKRGHTVDEIRYIATTGWRTDNLISAIKNKNLEDRNYNLVSLLIGVNNQYQHRPFSQFQTEFPSLLDSAIRYAGGNLGHVFVVSIPDYAFTPFGQSSSDPSSISQELDQYNEYARQISESKGVVFFDITPISRLGLQQPALVANDNLHPSGVQYTEWVKLILHFIDSQTAGIQDSKPSLFSVYPNPAKNQINIDMISDENGKTLVQLFNLKGDIILDKKFKSKNIIVSTSHFSEGIYFLKVKTGGKSELTKVLITN